MGKQLSPKELIQSHLPKKIQKFKVIIKDAELHDELNNDPDFDMNTLDTINNTKLVSAGYSGPFEIFDRSSVSKAKEPTVIDSSKGIVISKQLITKTDKKLLSVGINTYEFQSNSYVMIKFEYEKFDIVEVFLLIK